MRNVITASLAGIDAELINVEIDIQPGLPYMHLVGLADMTIKEAKERVRAAIVNSGFDYPKQRITVNLSPANVRKEGSHFDLPMAVGILATLYERMITDGYGFVGELSLDGKVKGIRGALPLALSMRNAGIKRLVIPMENAQEVSMITDVEIYPVGSLRQCIEFLMGDEEISIYIRKENVLHDQDNVPDFSEVKGNGFVKRALVIAAAGNHGVLMMGSPGGGKTMMAKRIPYIMPEMTYEERLEVCKIYSVAGYINNDYIDSNKRPFRAPHHTITKAAMIGGGANPYPGEISMAHNGVLFLDEFGEFNPAITELLRQPVEEGVINLHRARTVTEFPCRIMLVVAANPCKCGYFGDENHICTCTTSQRDSYLSRFSGPMLDRIDMHLMVQPVNDDVLEKDEGTVTTADMRKLVTKAVEIQKRRFAGTGIMFNSRMREADLERYCPLGESEETLLKKAYKSLGLSMRSYNKIIKISRTIADIEGEKNIGWMHIAEALQYRTLDQFYRR